MKHLGKATNRTKLKYLYKNLSQCHSNTNPTCTGLGSNPGLCSDGPATSSPNHGALRHITIKVLGITPYMWARQLSWYSDWLRAGRSGDQIPVERDYPPIQTGSEAHPASCTMGTGSFPGVKYSRGLLLTTHALLVPWSWKSRAIPLPTLWATTGPVTGTLYTIYTGICSTYNQA